MVEAEPRGRRRPRTQAQRFASPARDIPTFGLKLEVLTRADGKGRGSRGHAGSR